MQRWNHHKDEMGCGPDYPLLLPNMLVDKVWLLGVASGIRYFVVLSMLG
jgi:hypothetical protein